MIQQYKIETLTGILKVVLDTTPPKKKMAKEEVEIGDKLKNLKCEIPYCNHHPDGLTGIVFVKYPDGNFIMDCGKDGSFKPRYWEKEEVVE